jgi:hypothetical protein
MCGDLECPSCGPAQGNSRCLLCNAWVTSGCVHFEDDGADFYQVRDEYRDEYEAAFRRDAEQQEAAMLQIDQNGELEL